MFPDGFDAGVFDAGVFDTAETAPASHAYSGGGWGYFDRKRRRAPEDDETTLEGAFVDVARTHLLGDDLVRVLEPYMHGDASRPMVGRIDWAAIRRAGEVRAIWAALEAEVARRAREDDEDEALILLMAA